MQIAKQANVSYDSSGIIVSEEQQAPASPDPTKQMRTERSSVTVVKVTRMPDVMHIRQ